MKEEHKTREQLIDELAEMRQRMAELEGADTERVRAEEALRESEEHYRSIVESIDLGINLIDCDHNIVMVNAAQGRHFNKAPREMIGKKCFRELEKRDAVCPHCPGVEAIATGRPAEVETYGVRDDSSRFNVRLRVFPTFGQDGTVRGFVEVGQDITERKRAEEAVAEERNLLHTLINNLPDYIYVKDVEGRFVIANVAVARQLGFSSPDEVIGKSDFGLFPQELAVRYHAAEQEIIRSGEGLYDYEGPSIDASKEEKTRWVSTTKVPLRDAQGEITGFVGLGRDITERKRAEEALKEYSERLEEMVEERTQELRDAQEQLVRREKLAVLGQLAGGVGHELRNPLGAISNAIYFLNMVLEEPEPEVKETLEILEKEVAASEKIISSLLDFARAKPPTRRKVNINEVVQEALSRIAVPENVEVVSQLDEGVPVIQADPDQLGHVFGNIILNGIQAMSEGGRLVVRSEVSSSEWVAVSIADTGVGIPEENLGKLFEPLFTTKAKGVGLGLAVTKTLVDGHGGTIEVESEVGRGTTFRVRLPISVG